MRNLKSVLPKYYKNDALVEQLQAAAAHMEQDVSVVTNELRLETSEVILAAEEAAIGNIGTINATKEERADAVRARYRLVNSKLSLADLQAALDQTPYGGTISVQEPRGNPTVLIITFNGKGVPEGSDEFMDRLTESLPCNVCFKPVYAYNTHGDLATYTHADLEAWSHIELKESGL